MVELSINDNNINDFINCNPVEVIRLQIYSPNNIEIILNNLYKFVNLQILHLYNNQITEIKGLEILFNFNNYN